MKDLNYRICTKGVWDESVPGITFDEDGVSNYANMISKLIEIYPRGEVGKKNWEQIVLSMKKKGSKNRYDCIVGLSGGTDSCYLVHLVKEAGLRPLAVNLDNGWSSDIAVRNIKKIISALDVDLITYVIDYEEVKAVLRAYIKASLPWIDSPTDLAIKSALYKIAAKEKVGFILTGSDFRSEGKQPSEWTYSDAHQLLYLIKRFEKIKLKTFPYYGIIQLFYYGYFKKIKMHRPYYYIDYDKQNAQIFLKEKYGWEYYGGHHHENLFTKFSIGFWLPEKFGIDKRKITLSAQILSGVISREEALEELKTPALLPNEIDHLKQYVLKKLDLTDNEFNAYFFASNKFYFNYPSRMPFLKHFSKLSRSMLEYLLPFTPSIIIEQETRNRSL
jgi:N-acetyl sugar amidotransferase